MENFKGRTTGWLMP